LELSGIGRPDVLTKIGVETKVALPGVGENVQDHISCRFAFELNPQAKHETYDLMRDPEYAAKEMKLLCVYFTRFVRCANTIAALKARVTTDGVSLRLPSSLSPAPIPKTRLL
jgi:GMC oxidoreductase